MPVYIRTCARFCRRCLLSSAFLLVMQNAVTCVCNIICFLIVCFLLFKCESFFSRHFTLVYTIAQSVINRGAVVCTSRIDPSKGLVCVHVQRRRHIYSSPHLSQFVYIISGQGWRRGPCLAHSASVCFFRKQRGES